MARPSLKDVRTREILDAFVNCVAQYGLDGSTLERIAEEAGVRRTLLRHYLGNREEMVAKLLAHVIAKFEGMTDALIAELPEKDRWPALLDRMFQYSNHEAANATVFQALVAASDRYPDLKKPLAAFEYDFERTLKVELSRHFPAADAKDCAVVAAGVTSIYFTVESMLPLNPPAAWIGRQRRAADVLVATLSP